MTYRIWFRDGSKVSTKGGVCNQIDCISELRQMALQYAFDADEVLQYGETELFDHDINKVIGGVFYISP